MLHHIKFQFRKSLGTEFKVKWKSGLKLIFEIYFKRWLRFLHLFQVNTLANEVSSRSNAIVFVNEISTFYDTWKLVILAWSPKSGRSCTLNFSTGNILTNELQLKCSIVGTKKWPKCNKITFHLKISKEQYISNFFFSDLLILFFFSVIFIQFLIIQPFGSTVWSTVVVFSYLSVFLHHLVWNWSKIL